MNEILLKVKVLDNDSGKLTSLTDSARQVFIDTAVQVVNETLDELYSPEVCDLPKPKMLKQGSLSLVTGERTARLSSQSIALRREYNLVDRTNNHTIYILDEHGHLEVIESDTEQDDTGLPSFCAIDPTQERHIIFDRAPTASENGNTYVYFYDRELELSDKEDTFPFSNTVFRAFVPAATEMYRLYQHQQFERTLYRRSLARAASRLSRLSKSGNYRPRHAGKNITDPMEA